VGNKTLVLQRWQGRSAPLRRPSSVAQPHREGARSGRTTGRRLRRADEGIAIAETNVERVFAAELWRVKGELLLGQSRGAKRGKNTLESKVAIAADQWFRRALQIAREQEVASLALRAATSLARLSMGAMENTKR
jgi:hypothetical protein